MLTNEVELDKHTEQVVHDLQIRLQPILAYAENLYHDLRRIAPESWPIEDTVASADELLQSVLAMRVPIWNLGRFMPAYQFEHYSLAALTERAIKIYKAEAQRKEVDIRARLREPSRIQMSRDHLQHAVNNLLHNAIKYSFYGRYDLDRFVEVSGATDGFDYVLIFSNYGVGILPEEFARIFEPRYQGELTSEEYRSGSGMGLAIAKEIVDKHHGTIEVESQKKGGDAHLNKFIVRLPRIQPMEEEKEEK
jgi:two-component system OmpR family sensor kinase